MPAYSVVDAGVAFVAVAQSSAVGDSCRRLLVDLQHEGRHLVAPALWLYETTSIVTKAIRFGQLTVETGIQALELLGELELQLVEPDAGQRRRAYGADRSGPRRHCSGTWLEIDHQRSSDSEFTGDR